MDIEETIEMGRSALASSAARDPYGHRTQDLDEALELLSQCAEDGQASLPGRLQHACTWAFFGRAFHHLSTSTAYESAISSMQKLCFLHQLYSYNMPLSSRRPTIPVVCRWTMHRIWSTRVSSRKPSRPLKKGEPYYGLRCVTFVLQLINSCGQTRI
ncbi:hypothetical protein EDB83DRAFT_2389891 [Lactarius deliciosus]|nr:hypothetical protein EDB83DRAFT_2389891 [Lactarius deliciosus]